MFQYRKTNDFLIMRNCHKADRVGLVMILMKFTILNYEDIHAFFTFRKYCSCFKKLPVVKLSKFKYVGNT